VTTSPTHFRGKVLSPKPQNPKAYAVRVDRQEAAGSNIHSSEGPSVRLIWMVPAYRKYLKNQSFLGMAEIETDQMKGLPVPPIQKPYPKDAELIDLVSPEQFRLGRLPLIEAIRNRRSRRNFTPGSLTLEELSFLLWATQGVEKLIHNGLVTIRTVPSGGAMHPFETYLLINRVNGVVPGLYRYLALNHKLLKLVSEAVDLPSRINEAANGQNFVGESAVVLIWSARPNRTENRY
jgi:hypothetical protein